MRIKKVPKYSFKISNLDTDSISFCKPDESEFTKDERKDLLDEINSLMDEGISFADDGYFNTVIIFKAKNYIMFDESNKDPKKQIKTKGSSFKAPTLEKALKSFLEDCIESILKKNDYKTHLLNEYEKLVDEILSDSIDISRWVFRKGLTNKSLDEGTKNTAALKIQAALEQDEDSADGYNVMDRVFLYYAPDMSLKLQKLYNNDHNKVKLLEKLFKTGSRCDNILGKGFFPDYSKKRKYEELLIRKNLKS